MFVINAKNKLKCIAYNLLNFKLTQQELFFIVVLKRKTVKILFFNTCHLKNNLSYADQIIAYATYRTQLVRRDVKSAININLNLISFSSIKSMIFILVDL